MSKQGSLSARAKKKADAINANNERARQVDLLNKRMTIARKGVLEYQAGKHKEAVESFYFYLSLAERAKGVRSGGLEPKHFDVKKDLAEVLLISGIYWDLAKLYDRGGKNTRALLKTNLDRYVLFSKGMPFQAVCCESVRKYLVADRPVNRALFKDVYTRLGGGKCFIATALEDELPVGRVDALRTFRDQVLCATLFGQIFTALYYRLSPPLARLLIRMPRVVRSSVAGVLDALVFKRIT